MGNPNGRPRYSYESFIQNLLDSKIEEPNTGCWLWTKALKHGYPRASKMNKQVAAHREIYEWKNGKIPRGKIVRHKCDTPQCINPAHLEIGTHKENTKDMFDRKRNPDKSLCRHKISKISQQDVKEIFALKSKGETLVQIGNIFGISFQQVSKILNKQRWKDITQNL